MEPENYLRLRCEDVIALARRLGRRGILRFVDDDGTDSVCELRPAPDPASGAMIVEMTQGCTGAGLVESSTASDHTAPA
ncbi:MAG: hypothetical protein M3P34_01910, partial [Actinomycetota bacterium]|nr:hypothetical protein [Actinomycetota bacterium]